MEERLEKGNEGGEDGAFTQICLSFSFPHCFPLFLMVVFSPFMN